MKNKILLLSALLAVGVSLASCGGDSNAGELNEEGWRSYFSVTADDAMFDHFSYVSYVGATSAETGSASASITYLGDRSASCVSTHTSGSSTTVYYCYDQDTPYVCGSDGTVYESITNPYTSYNDYIEKTILTVWASLAELRANMTYDAEADTYTYSFEYSGTSADYKITFKDGDVSLIYLSSTVAVSGTTTSVVTLEVYDWDVEDRITFSSEA